MTKPADRFAQRKQALRARSASYRSQIHHDWASTRGTLTWKRAGTQAAGLQSVRSAAWGLALYGVSRGRFVRWIKVATGVLLLARLSIIAVQLLRRAPRDG
jgi:hypothetical protein